MVEVEPGVHRAGVAGTQGVGVPDAAAVSVLHVPNGRMFKLGPLSMTVAARAPPIKSVGWLDTINLLGASPHVHCSVDPLNHRRGHEFAPLRQRLPTLS